MQRVARNLAKQKYLYLVGLIVAVLVAWFIFFGGDSKKTSDSQPANYNTISDSSTGLSFNMSKKFEAIAKRQLVAMNPAFSYGFQAVDDPNAQCIIVRIELNKAGVVLSPREVRDNELKAIKVVHPDVMLVNEASSLNPAKFGKAEGLLLEIVYTDRDLKIKRVEVIAIGNVDQVTAYCQSLESDNAKYYNDFTTFFSSLKLDE